MMVHGVLWGLLEPTTDSDADRLEHACSLPRGFVMPCIHVEQPLQGIGDGARSIDHRNDG